MEFACLFLGEYGQIVFIRCLGILIFGNMIRIIVYLVIGICIAISFIWFRCSFPRFRYDLLMELA